MSSPEADTRRFDYEGRELRLVWDSSTGPVPSAAIPQSNGAAASAAPPSSPSIGVKSSGLQPQPPTPMTPQPMPSGQPSQWPTAVASTPAQNTAAASNANGAVGGSTAGTPVMAVVSFKAPMNDKLQKQIATVEPIHEEGEAQAAQDTTNKDADGAATPLATPSLTSTADPVVTTPTSTPKRFPLKTMGSFSQAFSSGDPGQASNLLSLRPKGNLRTTSSNFIIRFESAHGSATNFARILANAATAQVKACRHPDRITMAFWSQSKTLTWCQIPADAAPIPGPGGEALPAISITLPKSYITFAVPISALTVYERSASYSGMDVLVAGGPDIVWIDPVSARYTRFNKAGCITTSAVVKLAWCPPTSDSNLPTFLSAHADGTILHFALDRDDPSSPGSVNVPKFDSNWQPSSDILAWMHPPPSSDASSLSSRKQAVRPNPIVGWRCSKKVVTDLSVSPDPMNPGRFLAVTAEDGVLRIIDLVAQKLLDSYESYFGGLKCVSWSSDGAYVLTGGEDDLVSVYSPVEQRLLFRCQGHMSYVRRIAPEPSFEDSTKRMRTSLGLDREAFGSQYKQRFASVGEDTRLVLWDLASVAHHHRTASRLHQQAVAAGTRRQSEDQQPFTRMNLSSTLSLNTVQRKRTNDVSGHGASFALDDSSGDEHVWHEAPSRRDIPIFKPVASAPVASDILVDVAFVPSGCVVLTKGGSLRVFLRPLPPNTKFA